MKIEIGYYLILNIDLIHFGILTYMINYMAETASKMDSIA